MAITTPSRSSSDLSSTGGEPPLVVPPTVTNAREAEDEAARPLLARANLFRMRGQWDEAIAICTEALRRAPHSPSAHSLLGDVYEAQNKTDEAVQWYGMACDLDPTNQGDRAKLDKAIAAQNAKLLAEQKASGIVPPKPIPKPATEKTLEWIDRIFPPGKSESVARLIFALSGVIAVMILVAAAILWQSGRAANTLPTVQSLPGHGGDLPPVTSTRPVVVVPPASVVSAPARSETAPATPTGTTLPPPAIAAAPVGTTLSTSSATGAVGGVSTAPTLAANAAPIAARFTSLLAANAQVAPTLRLQNAQIDTAQNAVRLEVVAQVVAGEGVAQTRERIVRAAALAVRAASEANLTVASATVRVQLQTAPSATPVDAFSGALSLASARDMDVWGASPAELLSRFTSLQWSPSLGVAQNSPASSRPSTPSTPSNMAQTGSLTSPR